MVSRDCFRFLKDTSRASLKRLLTYQSRSHNYPRGFGIIRISEKKNTPKTCDVLSKLRFKRWKRLTSCQIKGSKNESRKNNFFDVHWLRVGVCLKEFPYILSDGNKNQKQQSKATNSKLHLSYWLFKMHMIFVIKIYLLVNHKINNPV